MIHVLVATDHSKILQERSKNNMQKLEELQAMFADGMIGSIDAKYGSLPLTIVREHENTYCLMKDTGRWTTIKTGTLKEVHNFIQRSMYKNCFFTRDK